MPDKFDAYRERLVVETSTIWPAEFDGLALAEKAKIERALHSDPQHCAELEYVRMHTGFCRQITVTSEDVRRVAAS